MAARNYPVNEDNSPITLEIQIGTAAGWTARVFKPILPATSGQFIVLAESDIENGVAVFHETSLATGAELKDVQLFIQIIGDFRNVDIDHNQLKNDPQFLRNAFFVNYIFRGGPLGEQVFDYDNDDSNFSTIGDIVVIDKLINLV